MKKVNANISVFSLIFWVVLVIAGVIWNISMFPLFFTIQILVKMITKYELGEDKITTKVLFEKTEIDLKKIRSYSVKEQSFWKQLFFGFPAKTIAVKFNKFDDAELFTTDEILLSKLEEASLNVLA